MDKKIELSLRHMQANHTTEISHNQQTVFTQAETISMLDTIRKELIKLNKTMKNANDESKKIEKSNHTLQIVMLILTFLTAIPIINLIIKSIYDLLNGLSDDGKVLGAYASAGRSDNLVYAISILISYFIFLILQNALLRKR